MKTRLALLILVFALLIGPMAAGAKEMVLEAQPTVSVAEQDLCDIFYVCSMWHEEYPVWCTDWHVIYCGPAIEAPESEKEPATRLVLESEKESRTGEITRLAPQYHLASGAVVEPVGQWNAKDAGGEQWIEVRPITKVQYTVANWEDRDRDGLVSAGDPVFFADGTRTEISAVRLGVHINVLESKDRK
jgi:hypothetical protein